MASGDPIFFAAGSGLFDNFMRGYDYAKNKKRRELEDRSLALQNRTNAFNVNNILPETFTQMKEQTAMFKAQAAQENVKAKLAVQFDERIQMALSDAGKKQNDFKGEFANFMELAEQQGGFTVGTGKTVMPTLPEKARNKLQDIYITERSSDRSPEDALEKMQEFLNSIPDATLQKSGLLPRPSAANLNQFRVSERQGPLAGIESLGLAATAQIGSAESAVGSFLARQAEGFGGLVSEPWAGVSARIGPGASRLIQEGAAMSGGFGPRLNPAFSGLLSPEAEQLLLRRP